MSDLVANLSQCSMPSQLRYQSVRTTSQYLPMADGVLIAVDVLLPGTRAEDERLPCIMVMTRYWRSFALRIPAPRNRAPISANSDLWEYLLARGFAIVGVDARGSGASFGVHAYPWSPQELADYAEVVDWISQQPWSNGKVGATGTSYEGTTAQVLPAAAGSGVQAIVSQQIEFDVYDDVAFPGGILNQAFIRAWSDSNQRQDSNRTAVFFPRFARLLIKGVRAVDGDKNGVLLRQALAEHVANPPVYPPIQAITYRDDPYAPGVTIDNFSVMRHQAAIERSGATLFNWGSWLDAHTADSVLRRWNSWNNPQVGVIGAWNHDGTQNASPYATQRATPTPEESREIQTRYLLAQLQATAQPPQKCLHYYTMGSESWHTTEVWPLSDVTPQRWYLQPEQRLGQQEPVAAGLDEYQVDFAATTGRNNRWHTELVKPVRYGNRAQADRRLLCYTSVPLEQPIEITGHPSVLLYLRSTHADGAVYVYLETVTAQGTVRYITEGQLRLIHRRTQDQAPHWVGGPYRSYTRADAAPFPIGEWVPVVLGLLPTSVCIPSGERLRLAIAGHDADTFVRLPTTGRPTLSIARQPTMFSYLELPIRQQA